MRFCAIGLAAAILLCSGCGREERREAVSFSKFLRQKDVDLAAVDKMEKDLLTGTRDWCDGIVASGGGRGTALDDNASAAKVLAQSAESVAAQLSTLRQAIYDQPLKEEFPQGVRGKILKDLTDRQKRLQDIRTTLEDSSAAFLGFRQSRTYDGNAYPAGVAKLASMLANYTGPSDPITKAIDELKTNYELNDTEIGPAPATKKPV